MNTIDTGGPAFPQPATSDGHATNTAEGMSLRDHFAGQALPALVQIHKDYCRKGIAVSARETASEAYEYADAMLAERARPETP